MCLAPITLKNENAAVINGYTRVVPCGKCPECQSLRRHEWAFRLEQEYYKSKSATFLTLTYEDPPETENGLPTLRKKDAETFLRYLRRNHNPHRNLKYYLVGEYGEETERPHYHALLFNVDMNLINYPLRMDEAWRKALKGQNVPRGEKRPVGGITHQGDVNTASVKYTLKYMLKGFGKEFWGDKQLVEGFARMSKGLGSHWLTPKMIHYLKSQRKHKMKIRGETYPLFRYYREKVFTPNEWRVIQLENVSDPFIDVYHGDARQEMVVKRHKFENHNKYSPTNKHSL